MAEPTGRAEPLGRSSPLDFARLATRKLVYRRVEMRRYEQRTGDSRRPEQPLELQIDLLDPSRFGEVLGSNPHSDPSDLENFRRQSSTCIVVQDGDRIAASTWMTSGEVHIHELHRRVEVPTGEHFSCRSFVDPDYRGLALLSHMIHHYAAQQPPDDVVWGLVFGWNVNSIRSLERIGWRHTGDYWTRWIADRPKSGERHFAPRPATTLGP